MSWTSRTPPVAGHSGLLEAPLKAVCSCLIGVVLLAMLCLGRPGLPVSAAAAQGAASVGVERTGDVAALLRFTGKAPALEIRAVRPVLAKFAGGHPVLPVPDVGAVWFEAASSGAIAAEFKTVFAPGAGANQPRAPPAEA
ncbi:hypothetical protein [Mesorhizobium sp. ES1-1]|uniref:hypothetical protein n=1 Tax=Mesorhizobium sp. ES1-1 TaxID=2876629 RepID=UPI001CCC4816|nr:hypothetical protein [Mesorhizobium sp. ES1-1]MBZ9677209.1 hypothetical protein [Mesorhizobium sp. ES1-1]